MEKGGDQKTCRGIIYRSGGDKQCRKIEYKPVYFGTFVVTREDVQQYMSHHPQYTKANRFKDIVLKVYI